MEFNEKLQELRKSRGLTQEELAASLYVSRTAISKWESGRGTPNVESLKAIARFFSVTVDELLSSDELLTIAEQEGKRKEKHLFDLVYGLLDICASLLLFLPLFAQRADGLAQSVSLLALDGISLYLKIPYFVICLALIATGLLTLALQTCGASLWFRSRGKLSLTLGVVSVVLFTVSLQPYAAIFSFVLLALKVILLLPKK